MIRTWLRSARTASTRRLAVPAAVVAGLFLLSACGVAEPAGTQEPSEQQVSWGETIYRYECARCHEPDKGAPELQPALLAAYQDAQALYDFISASMPLDDPGALPDEQYWDVTAYLLSDRGLAEFSGDETLGEDNAGDVSLASDGEGAARR